MDDVHYSIQARPELPVIWLDTHAIAQMATARARPGEDRVNVYLRELYDRLVQLRKEGEVFSFESDQDRRDRGAPRAAEAGD
jgi:hypothetical protein